jgi:hypothetical protein
MEVSGHHNSSAAVSQGKSPQNPLGLIVGFGFSEKRLNFGIRTRYRPGRSLVITVTPVSRLHLLQAHSAVFVWLICRCIQRHVNILLLICFSIFRMSFFLSKLVTSMAIKSIIQRYKKNEVNWTSTNKKIEREWEIKTRIKRQNAESVCELVNGLGEAGSGYDKQKKKIYEGWLCRSHLLWYSRWCDVMMNGPKSGSSNKRINRTNAFDNAECKVWRLR